MTQLNRADFDILQEATMRALEAHNNLKRVLAETFLKAQNCQEAEDDYTPRGNSDATIATLGTMLYLVDHLGFSELNSMAHNVGSIEYGKESESPLSWYVASRKGAEAEAHRAILTIADRFVSIHKKVE